METKICINCGKEFLGRSNGKYCKDCLNSTHQCPVCGKEIPVYQKTCSYHCSNVWMNKVYGNKGSTPEAQEKRKRTCLERYGVENGAQAQINKDKAKKVLTEKYGGYGLASQEIKKKAQQTTLERYGVVNPFQIEEVSRKRSEVAYASETRKKIEQTCLERYGSTSSLGSKEIQAKTRETCKEKYGVDWPSKSQEVKDKVRETCEKEHGGIGWGSPEILDKINQSTMQRYGVRWPSQAPEVREKAEQTFNERYGGILVGSPIIREKIYATNLEKYGVKIPTMLPEFRKIPQSAISSINKKWNDRLPGSELEVGVGRYSYDLKYRDILIEINPSYTHNSTKGPMLSYGKGEPKAPNYHLQKTIVANENGYNCFHIWDWDNEAKVLKLLLRCKEPVRARDCKLEFIEGSKANKFLELNHLQGSCKGQKVCIGLSYKEEFIAVMTFGKPRYNKNYQWELLRYASDRNVTGGAEKMFKYFVKTLSPESIISYCDRSKFRGETYLKLGFKREKVTPPNKHWWSDKERRHITNNLLLQLGADKLIGTSFGKGTDNEAIMKDNGYVEVYDCGQLVFSWSNQNN